MRDEAIALPAGDFKLRQPLFVLIGEAHDVVTQTARRWATKYGKKEILERGPSYRQVAGQELRDLAGAVQRAQSDYLRTMGPSGNHALLVEGEEMVSEIQSVREWHSDDGVQDQKDVQPANVVCEHANNPATPDAVAGEQEDYVVLANLHRAEIDGLGGFDASTLDRALELVRQLRAVPAGATATPEQEATRQALDLRNRLAWLLRQKVGLVRSAARFVFRDQPEVARLFTSTDERKRSAAARRAEQSCRPIGSPSRRGLSRSLPWCPPRKARRSPPVRT